MTNYGRIIKKMLKGEKKKGIVNLKFLDDKEIRRLNKKYRKIDRATDVLAFSMQEEGILGDIAISLDSAERNAKRFKIKVQDEVKRLVVHGVLHLLGYKHGEKMRCRENLYRA